MTKALKIANLSFACHCDYAHACYSLDAKGSKVGVCFFIAFRSWLLGLDKAQTQGFQLYPHDSITVYRGV